MASQSSEIVSLLYEHLEHDPLNIEARLQLLEIWDKAGSSDSARAMASEILQLDPSHTEASFYLASTSPAAVQAGLHAPPTGFVPRESRHGRQTPTVPLGQNLLVERYQALKFETGLLLEEFLGLQKLSAEPEEGDDEIRENLKHFSRGQISKAIASPRTLSVQESARNIVAACQTHQNQPLDLIIADFESIISWGSVQSPPLTTDKTRERLAKRRVLMDAALPDSMTQYTAQALSHVETVHLQRQYANNETMTTFESLSTISAANFFVTEDNYAWDMEELVAALEASEGVMRNPLSREMFSPADVKRIVAHPQGQKLKKAQDAQVTHKKGISASTVDWVARMGQVLLADDSQDFGPSHRALDEFLAFIPILTDAEQAAINNLRVPARDKNSRQQYDWSIGGSVQDAKSNKSCMHKVGDFLSQAAEYLSRS